MKAIVQSRYGNPADVLEFRKVDRPQVDHRQVLLRVHASAVNPADWMMLVGHPYLLRLVFGLARPKHKIPGKDVAGVVESVGPGVTRFSPGDEVYAELPGGAFAEYVVADEDALAAKPTSLSFAEAAAVPLAGITALQGMRDAGGVQAGQRVLVNGASGGVGTFAVQVAKSLGAHVTGVCSTSNLALVSSIGADEVIDYTRQDFTRGEHPYDVVFDLVGNHPLSAYRRILRSDGVYIASTGMPGGKVLGPMPFIFRVALSAKRGGPKMKIFAAKSTADDLRALARLIEAGQLSPVIGHTYGLSEAAEALARQGAGHAVGKTVLTV